MRRGRDAHGRAGRQAAWFRVTAAASSATLLGTLGLAGTSMAATGAAASAAKPAAATAGTSCHLGNGVKHVVTLVFDNVHFFRDNPNVPSDLEHDAEPAELLRPSNGTFLSNNHTPLIAHTARRHPDHAHRPVRRPARHADLQQLPGLQRPRTGRPTRRARSPTGPTRSSTPQSPPSAGHDTNPCMVYSPVPPATAAHPARRRTPSPRRPGCRTPGPAATSARWPRPTRSWRTPRSTSPRCSAPGRRRTSS